MPEPKTVASFWATWKSIVQGRSAAVSFFRPRRAPLGLSSRNPRQDPIFGRVFTERVQQRVRHVGLEAESLRLVHPLEQVDHRPPGVHPPPADLTLGSQLFAVIARDRRGLLERLGDLLLVALGSLAQSAGDDAESIRTTPYGRTPISRSDLAIRQALRIAVRKFSRCLASPIAEASNHTGATTEPTTKPLAAILPATAFKSSSLMSILMCGS